MSEPLTLADLILTLPIVAAILAWALAGPGTRKFAHLPLILACAGAAALSALLINRTLAGVDSQYLSEPLTWFAAGNFKANYTVAVDALAAVMLGMITFISTMIAVFSGGYMKGDKGFGRYFAVMGLFVFSMCGLVLANNFFLLLAFWEGVGLCSYLLVGYYYEKPRATAAARKAFLVTRLGDTGLIIGLFLLWRMTGFATTDLFSADPKHPGAFDLIARAVSADPSRVTELTAALLCLFCGAVGKSAQFPLYVWLPDAMEGPTPVSALIHAATMVTAGVYLLARCAPLFVLASDAQMIVSWIGGITALLAAFIALAQTDLKRILAYSTVSQLGFMFMALGTAGPISPAFAVTAAMFHLFTHAFFKALLFLSAGSVMHAMGGVIDVRQFGGLRRLMPVTHVAFLCGAAALAGVPLLSGFWSKDLILESLTAAGESRSPYASGYHALFFVACATAFLTAFYTFRAYFLTFWGPRRIPEEAGHHAHESPGSMTVPLVVLAVGALSVGAALEPFTHWFSTFLETSPSLARAAVPGGTQSVERHLDWNIMATSAVLALLGIALAFTLYRNGDAEKTPSGLAGAFALSRHKLYVDEIYYALFVRPAEVLAFLARVFDGFLDGLSRFVAAVPRFVGAWVRPIQNGLAQFYALAMALGVAVFLTFVVFRITR